MRVLGPFVLVICVALAYAAVLPPVRRFANTYTGGDTAGVIVLIAAGAGATIRLVTAMRLDEWSWRRAADSALEACAAATLWIAKQASALTVTLSSARTRLIDKTGV